MVINFRSGIEIVGFAVLIKPVASASFVCFDIFNPINSTTLLTDRTAYSLQKT